MSYQIDQKRVIGVVTECNFALDGKGFNHGEVILGLAELMGRIIVETSETSLQARDLSKVAVDHLTNTITIGAQATGKSNILMG
jgi:hypothetical protein